MSNICCVMKKKNHLQFKDIEKENKGFLKAFPDFSLGPYPGFLRTDPNLSLKNVTPPPPNEYHLYPPVVYRPCVVDTCLLHRQELFSSVSYSYPIVVFIVLFSSKL